MIRWKVCCISSVDEAERATRAGAAALGLVSAMPSGPGVVDDATIASIIDAARERWPEVSTFLLTSRTTTASLVEQHRRLPSTTLQLCDAVLDLPLLRAALPGVELVQVIHVRSSADVDDAVNAAAHVDALLLDSGRPDRSVKELGGTGRVHDWSISRRIVEAVAPTPVFLAGGLTPDNVRDAVAFVGPAGIDVCSGARTNGALDDARLRAFAQALGRP